MKLNYCFEQRVDIYLLHRLDKLNPIVYNILSENMNTERQQNMDPKEAERDKHRFSLLPQYPLVNFLRGCFSWKNIHEKLFGGNALPGHGIAALAGMLPGVADYALSFRSEPTILTMGPVAVLVASLLIPYQGYDRIKESRQANIITFGPMFTIGTTAGGMISTRLQELINPTPDRIEMLNAALNCVESASSRLSQIECLQSLVAGVPLELLTTSNVTGLGGAVGVIVSYITVGYMSRDKRWEYLSIRNLPESVKKVGGSLMLWKDHILADRINRGILASNEWGLKLTIHTLNGLKKTAYIEEPKTLEQLQDEITAEVTEDADPENPQYFQQSDERLPLWLIEKAQEDLVEYHYGDPDSSAAVETADTRIIRKGRRLGG